MPLGPCISEYTGDVYLLFDKPASDSNIVDEIVTGLNKQILKALIPENRWYLGSLVRCCGKTSAKIYKTCSNWLLEEIVDYNYIISFGLQPMRFLLGNRSARLIDYLYEVQTSERFGNFLCIPDLYSISTSTSDYNKTQSVIGNYIGIR